MFWKQIYLKLQYLKSVVICFFQTLNIVKPANLINNVQ